MSPGGAARGPCNGGGATLGTPPRLGWEDCGWGQKRSWQRQNDQLWGARWRRRGRELWRGERATSESRQNPVCGHEDVCPWRLGQRPTQSPNAERMRKGVRKVYDTGKLPGQRRVQVNQCFLSISAFILCLSCFQSSNRAERHMAKCLSRGIIIRKPGGKDKDTLNSVPQE